MPIVKVEIEALEDAINQMFGYEISFFFTKHGGEHRLNHSRNTPLLDLQEIEDIFLKIHNNVNDKNLLINFNQAGDYGIFCNISNIAIVVIHDPNKTPHEHSVKTIMRDKNFKFYNIFHKFNL